MGQFKISLQLLYSKDCYLMSRTKIGKKSEQLSESYECLDLISKDHINDTDKCYDFS